MDDIQQAIADSEWWQALGDRLGLGRCFGFTFRHCASFDKDGHVINVNGALVDVLLKLDQRLTDIEGDQMKADEIKLLVGSEATAIEVLVPDNIPVTTVRDLLESVPGLLVVMRTKKGVPVILNKEKQHEQSTEEDVS